MNAAALLARYEQIADAPDAIERLRRFVLDLALRGKLSRQLDDDVALGRLGHEPTRKLGVQKLNSADNPFTLPTNWVWTSIGAVAKQVTDGEHSTPPRIAEKEVPLVTAKNVRDGHMDYGQTDWVSYATAQKAWVRCRPSVGDLLLVCVGATTGRLTVLREPRDMVLVRSVALIRPGHDVSSEYLERAIRSQLVQTQIWASVQATAQPCLYINRIQALLVPLPPLAEQHRIVAKVDELIALCDRLEAARLQREATRDRLAAASLARLNTPDPETFQADARFAIGTALPALTARTDQIKQLRQTILNLAASGRLVPQIEAGESADGLVQRAREAKSVAEAEEGIRSRPPIEPASRENIGCAVPSTWAVAAFDDLFVIVSGVTKGNKIPASEAIDAPYLRVANVQRGHLDLSVIKTIPVRASDVERYALRSGDVLMTEGGDWDKLGRAAVWNGEIPGCIHQNHVFRVRASSPDILPRWITTYVNSPIGRAFFEDASKQTTNLASINMTQLRACPIPVPPRSEQHRIVAKVDELMALCDRLDASLTQSASSRSRLLNSLLHEALAPAERELEAA